MFDRFYLPVLVTGGLLYVLSIAAQSAGLISASVQGTVQIISIVCIGLGVFLAGRIAGKTMLKKAREKANSKKR